MLTIPQWLKDWFIESYHRLRMKRPRFFTILDRIASLVVLIPGIPYFLRQVEQILLNDFHIHYTFPEILTVLSNKFAMGIGLGLKLGSWLTVKQQPVAQTESGEAITVLEKSKMPFTVKSEAKDIASAVPPPPVVPEVPDPVPEENKDK